MENTNPTLPEQSPPPSLVPNPVAPKQFTKKQKIIAAVVAALVLVVGGFGYYLLQKPTLYKGALTSQLAEVYQAPVITCDTYSTQDECTADTKCEWKETTPAVGIDGGEGAVFSCVPKTTVTTDIPTATTVPSTPQDSSSIAYIQPKEGIITENPPISSLTPNTPASCKITTNPTEINASGTDLSVTATVTPNSAATWQYIPNYSPYNGGGFYYPALSTIDTINVKTAMTFNGEVRGTYTNGETFKSTCSLTVPLASTPETAYEIPRLSFTDPVDPGAALYPVYPEVCTITPSSTTVTKGGTVTFDVIVNAPKVKIVTDPTKTPNPLDKTTYLYNDVALSMVNKIFKTGNIAVNTLGPNEYTVEVTASSQNLSSISDQKYTCKTTVTAELVVAPTCDVTATPAKITSGATSTLKVTSSIPQSQVSKTTVNGTPISYAQSQAYVVNPAASYDYKVEVTDSKGNVAKCATGITVEAPVVQKPQLTCAITASPSTVTKGGTTVLTISTPTPATEITKLTLDGTDVANSATKTKTVSPTTSPTQNYYGRVEGTNGLPADCSVTVTVKEPDIVINPEIKCPAGTTYDAVLKVCVPPSSTPEVKCSNPTHVYDAARGVCVPPVEIARTDPTPPTQTIYTVDQTRPAAPQQYVQTTALHGAYIQGKTGPAILLYPLGIAAANAAYFVTRSRRRKTKK